MKTVAATGTAAEEAQEILVMHRLTPARPEQEWYGSRARDQSTILILAAAGCAVRPVYRSVRRLQGGIRPAVSAGKNPAGYSNGVYGCITVKGTSE